MSSGNAQTSLATNKIVLIYQAHFLGQVGSGFFDSADFLQVLGCLNNISQLNTLDERIQLTPEIGVG